MRDHGYVAYPPGGDFLLLPRAPARATRTGLALYEAVEPRQLVALRLGDLLARSRLHRLLPSATHARVDWAWWSRLVTEVAEPHVGRVAHISFRIPSSARVAALLADERGRPVGFAKITEGPRTSLAAAVDGQLARQRPRTFIAPTPLVDDHLDGVDFRLLEPLPEGPHRPPPDDVARVNEVVDEFHTLARDLQPPANVPAHHVACHADLTPRNLRVTADDRWMLFDWDTVRWGPRLADELRYWCAALVYRGSPDIGAATTRVLVRLRARGDDEEIRAAVEWADAVPKTYRRAERVLRAAVGAAVLSS